LRFFAAHQQARAAKAPEQSLKLRSINKRAAQPREQKLRCGSVEIARVLLRLNRVAKPDHKSG
jgi:hypothetical protein